MKGLITKGIAGFYYVKTEEGTYECKARGLFKNEGVVPMVGDIVEMEKTGSMEGYINNILPRKNEFIRPPIANVDQFIVVVSAEKPKLNYLILDRFLVMAELSHTDIVIAINKKDSAKKKAIEEILDVYRDLYPCVVLSAVDNEGIGDLSAYLANKISALAGISGVGKTTILNQLQEDFNQETGSISHKTGRGKHTTRHVEIFPLKSGGAVFDTPGFTSFEILDCKEDELAYCYPEMEKLIGTCKYDNCRHINEPMCSIIEANKDGKIKDSRYASYKAFMNEIRERRNY